MEVSNCSYPSSKGYTHPNHASLDGRGDLVRLGDILCEYCSTKAIFSIICLLDSVLLRAKRLNDHEWPEYLLAHYLHVTVGVLKDRRLYKEARGIALQRLTP